VKWVDGAFRKTQQVFYEIIRKGNDSAVSTIENSPPYYLQHPVFSGGFPKGSDGTLNRPIFWATVKKSMIKA
jgi:hypothetical protein